MKKLCIDCEHYRAATHPAAAFNTTWEQYYNAMCAHENAASVVDGSPALTCEDARRFVFDGPDKCGQDGKWFQKRETPKT